MTLLEDRSARVAFMGIRVAAEAIVPAPAHGAAIDWAPITALYLLVTSANVPAATAARAYGCSKQYVSRVIADVEDRRDDPAYDAQLQTLEQRIFGEV